MNLGQFLTAKSPLPSGTVAQHLAAIAASTGTGTGVDRIIYCSQMTTVLTQDEIVVTRKPKRLAPESKPVAAPVVAEKSTRQQATFFAFSPQQTEIVSLFEPDEITVTQRQVAVTVEQSMAQETITRKPKRVAIN